jgi:hypothetical protein
MGAGQNLFVAAQIQRLSWGEAMRHEPPAALARGQKVKRPAAAYHVSEAAVAAGEGIAIRVEHLQKDLAGCRLMVEMTPATKSLKNKPLDRWLTKAGATDAGSYFPLAETGAAYVLADPRYDVAPGQRFAVRVTIIDADGIRGQSCGADLIRQEHAAPMESMQSGHGVPPSGGMGDLPSRLKAELHTGTHKDPPQSGHDCAADSASDFRARNSCTCTCTNSSSVTDDS